MTNEHETTEAQIEELKAEAKKPKSKRLAEEALLARYPHALPGSLRFLDGEEKQAVTIVCVEDGCDEERTVRTSDLFQVKRCEACTAKVRQERRRAKRVAEKALLAEAKEKAKEEAIEAVA